MKIIINSGPGVKSLNTGCLRTDSVSSCIPLFCQLGIFSFLWLIVKSALLIANWRHGPCPAGAGKLSRETRNREETAKSGFPQSNHGSFWSFNQRCPVRMAGALRHGELLPCEN